MNNKELLLEKINERKAELSKSRRNSESWNSGSTKQYGNSGRTKQFRNTHFSQMNVKALEKEIKELSEELRKLQIPTKEA